MDRKADHRIRSAAGLLLVLAFLLGQAGCKKSRLVVDPGFDDPPAGGTFQLMPPLAVGDSVFPIGNTAQGGQGEPIGGVGCIETIAYHVHAHLAFFANGRQVAIPGGIGIVDPFRTPQGSLVGNDCLYWVHTHDATGILHIEPPTQQTVLNLGHFFDVWGQPLSGTGAAGYQGEVVAYVNGQRHLGDVRSVTLERHKLIVLYVGTPRPPRPTYLFPPGL